MKNNNILDEAEKHTGPRTCPNCGYQFPFRKFVRLYVLSYGLSKWSCQSCGELIGCGFVRLQIIWLIGILISSILVGVLTSYFDLDLFNILFLVPYFTFFLLTLFYVKFEKI